MNTNQMGENVAKFEYLLENETEQNLIVYIYIYVCVCVCVYSMPFFSNTMKQHNIKSAMNGTNNKENSTGTRKLITYQSSSSHSWFENGVKYSILRS